MKVCGPYNTLSLEKCREPGLFEVMVAGECLGNSHFFHGDKRNAIGQRPFLVWPIFIQGEASLKESLIGFKNDEIRVVVDRVIHAQEDGAVVYTVKRICKLS